jgi:AcrR family transcriptional regulator
MARPPGHGPSYEVKRQEIIDLAAGLFAKKGYAATGIVEIGETVGLAKGALYYYIRSKENLLVEIQERVLDPLVQSANRIAELDTSPAVQLRLLSHAILDMIFTRFELAMLQFLNMHNHTYQWLNRDLEWDAAYLSKTYCQTLFTGFAGGKFDVTTLEAEVVRIKDLGSEQTRSRNGLPSRILSALEVSSIRTARAVGTNPRGS